MRDPARIPMIIQELEAYWYQYGNVNRSLKAVTETFVARFNYNPFYIEDTATYDILVATNKEYAKRAMWPSFSVSHIDDLMRLLREYWLIYPDLRLFQLLECVHFMQKKEFANDDIGTIMYLKKELAK